MPDPNSIGDEAARYVLGEMTPGECSEFEGWLERSAELRALVRELEEGAMALAAASPARRLPLGLWPQIEKALERERRGNSRIWGWWVGWIRSGWAAATVCVVGWVLYALWVGPPSPANISTTGSQAVGPRDPQIIGSQPKERNDMPPLTHASSNAEFSLLQARIQETTTLRRQITELEYRLIQASRTVTQQQALLSESNRLKFFQLTPGAGDGNDPTTVQSLSPRLQWALYMAMARELGWRPPANVSGRGGDTLASDSTATGQPKVDYVDLRPTSNNVANPTSPPQNQTELASASQGSSNTVAGFVSGTSAFLGFDSMVAPAGSSLTFWVMGTSGQYVAIGNTMYWNNTTVVAVPASIGSGDGSFLTVTATTPTGAVTNIGHVYWQGVPAP